MEIHRFAPRCFTVPADTRIRVHPGGLASTTCADGYGIPCTALPNGAIQEGTRALTRTNSSGILAPRVLLREVTTAGGTETRPQVASSIVAARRVPLKRDGGRMPIVRLNGSFKAGGKIPSGVNPKADWGSSFSREHGFILAADRIRLYVFVDNRLMDISARRVFTSAPATIGHVVGTSPEVDWHVEAEPIATGKLGLVVYNTRKKALLAGTYDLSSSTIELASLYPGITNKCKQTVEIKGTYKSGDTTVSGDYKIEYEQ